MSIFFPLHTQEDLPVDVNCKPTITKEMLTEGDTPCPCSEAYVDVSHEYN